jgi:hypothetical protein
MEGVVIKYVNGETSITLPRDLNTSFHSENSREYYLKIHDTEFIEIFPMQLHTEFKIPIPDQSLWLREFGSVSEFEQVFAARGTSPQTIRATIGSSAREVVLTTEMVTTSSIGAKYIHQFGSVSTRHTDVSGSELRQARLQAQYHNTWKEVLHQTESNVLSYSQAEDFIGRRAREKITGKIIIYQRAAKELGILCERRGYKTGIVI